MATRRRLPHVVAGLFAGIGGIELGLSRSGHRTDLLCELDEGAQAVLHARFPTIPKHGDVTTLETLPPKTTLLTAGFPCQDLSQAGRTKGIHGARSGLVGEVFRLLMQHQTPWLLIENVPFMLQLAKGEALEVIVSTLEHLGYNWAYRVVDARAFGLPQRRRRVYLLASLHEDPRSVLFADQVEAPHEPTKDRWREVACGFYWTEGSRGLGWAHDAVPTLKGGSTVGIPSPPAIVMPGEGPVVTPHICDAERLQGFDPDWTKPAEVVRKPGFRWKLVGNAVSVNAAEWIGGRMREPDTFACSDARALTPGAPWPRAAWNVDRQRMTCTMSEWPLLAPRQPLAEFLERPGKPLSLKATRGFLSRAREAALTFPSGFLDTLERHAAAGARES